MIGVILWNDVREQKAVIWCEDQGHLAYMSRYDSTDEVPELDVGDVVQFEIEVHQNLRLAQNVQRLTTQWGAAAVNALRSIRKEPPSCETCAPTGAEIIPFRLADARAQDGAHSLLPQKRKRRMGDRS